ncbi:MAG: hypothetical protein WC374_09080 [Phycisphaerae bacterium]
MSLRGLMPAAAANGLAGICVFLESIAVWSYNVTRPRRANSFGDM